MLPLILKMKAFGSYGKETVIDFSKSTQKLFLITGDTGAGKTTIFDAIVFALYGQASSVSNKKDGILLQSHFTSFEEEPKVEFIFAKSAEDKEQIYKITRVPKHLRPAKRRGKNGNDYIEEKGFVELMLPDGNVYAEKNTDEKIEEIIGLTREQFMQVVMIAQGEFMELLRAKTDDKKEIFRKLFNTEIYEKIRRILEERKKEKEKEIAIIKTQCQTELEHVAVPDEFEKSADIISCSDELKKGNISQLTQYIAYLEEMCAFIRDREAVLVDKWQSASKALDTAKEKCAKAESLMTAFERYEQAKALVEKYEELKPETDKKEQLVLRLKEAYDIEPVYKIYKDADNELCILQKKLDEQEKNLPELNSSYNKISSEYESLRIKYEEESRTLHDITQKADEALQLFDRKEKLESDKAKALSANKSISGEIIKNEAKLKELNLAYESCTDMMKSLQNAALNKSKTEAELIRLKQLGERLEKLNNFEKDISKNNKRLAELQKELIEANNVYLTKAEFYEKQNALFLSEQAGILAAKLADGKPCIVCGSIHHPSPYKISSQLMANIPSQEEVEAAKADSDSWNEIRQQKAVLSGELKASVGKQKEQYDSEKSNICEQLETDGDKKLTDIFAVFEAYKSKTEKRDTEYQKELDILEEQKELEQKLLDDIKKETDVIEKLKQDINASNEEMARISASLCELENHTEFTKREEAQKAVTSAKERFDAIYDEYTKKEAENKNTAIMLEKAKSLIEEYKNSLPVKKAHMQRRKEEYTKLIEEKGVKDWQSLTHEFSREDFSELQEQVLSYRKASQEALVRKETTESAINNQDKPDITVLRDDVETKRTLFNKIDEQKAYLSHISENNKSVLYNLKSQIEKREKIIHEHTKLDNLYRMISGNVNKQNKMDLETFVQRYYLRRILTAANKRFEKMTAGQFILELKDIDDAGRVKNEGLDLMVYSLVTGKKREVRTLSGGESFMAALSLALGMADCIKEGSGALHLDMMFIDEGFGSLDEHSRGQAVRILKDMAGSDRTIGIISHVSELKQEIDAQLVVTKNETGSSAYWQ